MSDVPNIVQKNVCKKTLLINGTEVEKFQYVLISTDKGSFRLGEPCLKCGKPIVPRIIKKAGGFETSGWCPACGE